MFFLLFFFFFFFFLGGGGGWGVEVRIFKVEDCLYILHISRIGVRRKLSSSSAIIIGVRVCYNILI